MASLITMGGIDTGADEAVADVCAASSGGLYIGTVVGIDVPCVVSPHLFGKLIAAAKKMGADYAVDIYPHYGSDVEATLRGGADIRHGLIGAGVYASHGYERSHIDGVYNSILTIAGYLNV